MAERRAGHIHNNKGVSCALVLTIRELRNFICLSKTKQRGRLMGVLYPFLPFRLGNIVPRNKWLGLYIYTYVGLSALLVSTDRAMRRPSNRGTSNRTGSTFFCVCMHTIFLINRQEGAIGKKNI